MTRNDFPPAFTVAIANFQEFRC